MTDEEHKIVLPFAAAHFSGALCILANAVMQTPECKKMMDIISAGRCTDGIQQSSLPSGARRDVHNSAKNQQQETTMASLSMPIIEGSARQKTWAEQIRRAALRDTVFNHQAMPRKKRRDVETVLWTIPAQATWWIEHQKDAGTFIAFGLAVLTSHRASAIAEEAPEDQTGQA